MKTEARQPLPWMVATLLFVIIRALPNISYPIFRDQATYWVIAQRLLEGQKLYRDVWDNKPPGIFWIYMPIVKAFGPTMSSVGVADILWLLAISGCIFWLSQRYLGTAAAAIAAAVNAEWHCRAGYEHAAQADTFLILFVLGACLVAWRASGRPLIHNFCAGLLFGAAFWTKYTAVAFLPLLVLVPCLDLAALDSDPARLRLAIPWRACLKRALMLAAGWLTAVVAVLSYFWRAGLLTMLETHLVGLSRFGVNVLHWQNYWARTVSKIVVYLGPSLLAFFIGLPVARKRRELGRLMPVFAGCVLGFGAVVSQLTFFSHTFEDCFPFFAMVWAYLAAKSFDKLKSADRSFAAQGRRLAQAVLRVVVAGSVLLLLAAEGSTVVKSYEELRDWSRAPAQFYAHYPRPFLVDDLEDQMGIIGLLREAATPGDGLYVWGHYPLIYYLTGLRAPTRFVVSLPFSDGWALPEWRNDFISDLEKSPPKFFVASRRDAFPKSMPELQSFVAGHYRSLAVFPHFVVYRRTAAVGGMTVGPGH